MDLISIYGERFCSFKEPFSFSLCREPGLYLLKGNNLAQPHLGGNGVGKSTIWDAVIWCFTGTTSRKLKNTDIKPWGTSGSTRVSVSFVGEDEEDLITVTRTTSPNELWLSSDKHQVEQELTDKELMDFIKMDETQLLHSLIISQFGDFFLDLKPSPKQELFSSLLKLDVWLERSKLASSMVKIQKEGLNQAELEYGKVQAALDQIGDQCYDGKAKEWDYQQAADLQYNRAELKVLEDELSKCSWERIEKDILFYENLLNDVESTITEVSAEVKQLDDELAHSKSDQRREDDKIEDALDDLDSLLKRGECSYCNGSVSDREIARIESRTKALVNDGEDKIDELIQEQEQIRLSTEPKLTYLENQKHERDGLRDKLADLDSDGRALSKQTKHLKREIRNVEKVILRLQESRNPFAGLRDKNEADRLELGAQLVSLGQAITNINQAIERTSYWVKGFKDLRLSLIDQYLNDLEIEVNNSIKQLGLDGWRIEFSTERETQRKTIKRGFEVYVYSPDNKKPVKWECWSGGESSRLKLAGQIGIMSLVNSATGSEPNLEVYDEPTTYMSQEGIEDLLELLKERAQVQQKQIYIIDHHSINFGGFDQVITIERDEHTSRIVEG